MMIDAATREEISRLDQAVDDFAAEMKALILTFTLVCITLAAVVAPIAIERGKSKPLYGLFSIPGHRCMCGHQIFWEFQETEAFDTCPGHGQRSKRMV